ncbi:MAG: hypothetical protein JEY99_15235 [Spirochaetales bacterium]|nr:hypothetical protein [Spirochaetales bacterium]
MKTINIIQSPKDTPCRVKVEPRQDKSFPGIHLSKWDEESYLSILPGQRGEKTRQSSINKNTLEIITNRRCHRIHRLNESQIEYDIILEEKPKSTVIPLPLKIPPGISFHKQGIKTTNLIRPEVMGSYALYYNKKNNKYKTGKMSHIYRPRIFDKKGHWCWGELDYDGRSLNMIIPKEFLLKCTYPITVDPVIGTDSVGASHQYYDEGWYDYKVEGRFTANYYDVPGSLKYECEAYLYSDHPDPDGGAWPCLYSNSSMNPQYRRSSNEDKFDLDSFDDGGEWIYSYMEIPNEIEEGGAIWLGLMPDCYFYPYFDEMSYERESTSFSMGTIPNTFPSPFTPTTQIVISAYLEYTVYNNYGINLTTAANITAIPERSHEAERSIQTTETPLELPTRSCTHERAQTEEPQITENLIRSIFMSLKLTGLIHIWDYLLHKKAKSKDEMKIISPVCREIDIDSPV